MRRENEHQAALQLTQMVNAEPVLRRLRRKRARSFTVSPVGGKCWGQYKGKPILFLNLGGTGALCASDATARRSPLLPPDSLTGGKGRYKSESKPVSSKMQSLSALPATG